MISECWRGQSGRQNGRLVDRLQSQYDGTDVRVDDEVAWHAWRRQKDAVCHADRDDDGWSVVVRGCLVRAGLPR